MSECLGEKSKLKEAGSRARAQEDNCSSHGITASQRWRRHVRVVYPRAIYSDAGGQLASRNQEGKLTRHQAAHHARTRGHSAQGSGQIPHSFPAQSAGQEVLRASRSPSTRDDARHFEEVVDMDFIGKNPARKIPLPECRASRRPVLAPEALRKLFAAVIDPCDRLLLLVATFCAVRTSEVLGLTWRSYEGDSFAIHNIAWEGKFYEGKTKTKKSRAPVYVPLELRREIESWRIPSDPQSGDALMFPSRLEPR